jgi:hypothetical protein
MENNQKLGQLLRDVVKRNRLSAWSRNLIETIEFNKDAIVKYVEDNPSFNSIELSDFIDFGEVIDDDYWFDREDAAICILYHFDFKEVSLWVDFWQQVEQSNRQRGKLSVRVSF